MSKNNTNHWTLDKRIPLAVIIGLLIQLAGALVWAAKLDARVIHIEQQTLSQSSLNERFARLEERLDHVKGDTDAMKRLLSHIAEKLINN